MLKRKGRVIEYVHNGHKYYFLEKKRIFGGWSTIDYPHIHPYLNKLQAEKDLLLKFKLNLVY